MCKNNKYFFSDETHLTDITEALPENVNVKIHMGFFHGGYLKLVSKYQHGNIMLHLFF